MARTASQAKLGYYKTPVSVVELIREAVTLHDGMTLLDPCCGDGEALSIFTEGIRCRKLGIELEADRYNKAKGRLDRVLHADAIVEAVIGHGCIDLMWLNPPYDYDDAAGEANRAERFETQFVEKYVPAIASNGLMILIIPFHQLRHKMINLLAGFAELGFYKFPDPEYDDFNQIVVVGRKGHVFHSEYNENVEIIKDQDAHVMPSVEEMPPIEVGVSKHRKRLFLHANHVDPAEVAGLTTPLKDQFFKSVKPANLAGARPLTPLRQGHMAMLLAAGLVNGELKNDKHDLVIKGSVERKNFTTEETTATHRITRTTGKVVITVRALNMATGEIETIAT